MNPDFTIITPNRNGGRFLRDCLESVAAQDGVTIEHWLIDGLSTDDSLGIAAAFPHVRILSEADGGMSEAINKGYERATGEWILWLNSDDRLLHGVLAKVLAFARKNPSADIIHGDTVFVDENGGNPRRKLDHANDSFVSVFGGSWMLSTSTFVHRHLIESGLRLDESYRVAMDYELFLRAGREGARFCYFPEAVAEFRWHRGNLSVVQDAKRKEENKRLLREHARARGWPSWWVGGLARSLLFPLAKVKRIWLRWRTHGKLR
jgi:glycosyltransferase involved in cell wall biosynthesis